MILDMDYSDWNGEISLEKLIEDFEKANMIEVPNFIL